MKNSQHSLVRSFTRMTLLDWCERKYYFNYYAYAFKQLFPELGHQLFLLKKLKSFDMWVGEKTHYLLSDYLSALRQCIQQGGRIDVMCNVSTFKDTIASEMRQEFDLSQHMNYSDFDSFFQHGFGLSEHYYQENMDQLLDRAIQKVHTHFEHFLSSMWANQIVSYLQEGISLYIETPRSPSFDAMKVSTDLVPGFHHVPLMALPDFGILFSSTDFLIIDRKTGMEDILFQSNIPLQLGVYALKTLLKSGSLRLEGYRIQVEEVFLDSLHSYGGIITQQDIDAVIQQIQGSIEHQLQFVQHQDPLKNLPVDFSKFQPCLSEKKCATCTFRALCKKISF